VPPDDAQVQKVMNRWADKADPAQILGLTPNEKGAGLMSGTGPVAPPPAPPAPPEPYFDWPEFWKTTGKEPSAKYVVDKLLDPANPALVPAGIRAVLQANRDAKKPDEDIVKNLKALTDIKP